MRSNAATICRGSTFQAGLFLQLAPHAFRQVLTEFEHAAGNGPLALQRLAAAANQESPPTVDNDSADADDGTIWIFAPHLFARKTGKPPHPARTG